jgi:hypothetical protein
MRIKGGEIFFKSTALYILMYAPLNTSRNHGQPGVGASVTLYITSYDKLCDFLMI